MQYTATYSPEDDKLRLSASSRLAKETYQRVKDAGFQWAPKQGVFYAVWTPSREDLLLELAGEIADEDTSLVDRAETRAERFEEYSERRAEDAERAREAVSRIADNIPLGQPILVGHHSEKRARKDAEKIENGMRRAVKMWETSQYWQDRAKAAIRHAKYKERPDVRARRIKGLETDRRKEVKTIAECKACIENWGKVLSIADTETRHKNALYIANYSRQTPWGTWSDLDQNKVTVEQAAENAVNACNHRTKNSERWLTHIDNRLTYERALLAESGGTASDQTKPEKNGGCKCWASPDGGWSYIVKVNKVSVSVLDNWGNGGANFIRTIPLDKLSAIMSAQAVQDARDCGQLVEAADKTGFYLRGEVKPRQQAPVPEATNANFEALKEALRHGVKTVSAPQLFPTPTDLAERMAEEADLAPGMDILEPSAGTGNLCDAILNAEPAVKLFAVEINHQLCEMLSQKLKPNSEMVSPVLQGDFLECNGNLGQFDRIVMNPPFSSGDDIQHIKHALHMLKPGGRLVALCANGPRQQEQLRPLAENSGGFYEELPPGTFKEAGTLVNTALVVIHNEGHV